MNNHLHAQQTGKGFTKLLLTAAILTFLLLMAGYLVRFDGSGNVCPDWPTCYGQWGMPAGLTARLEMAHRILAAITTLVIIATTILASFRKDVSRSIKIFLSVAALGVLVESFAGGRLVSGIPAVWQSNLHLGLALLTLALVTAAAVKIYLEIETGATVPDPEKDRSFPRLTVFTLLAVFAVMISGAWLTSSGVASSCAGWPLCAGGLPDTIAGWVAFGHRLLTLAAGVLISWMFFAAWKKHYRQPVILTSATGAAVLFVGQVLISALKVSRGYPIDLVGLHAAATAALWAVLTITLVAAFVEPWRPLQEDLPEHRPAGINRWKAFLMLNKPVIVALLLVTTFAGMVVGGRQMPPLALAFWTLLGGALSAGGASALNQVIDRQIDGQMQRTAKRPLPSGALTPAEGLAYGLGACLAAFFIMAGFVNLLAAVLSLAGMIYYVLLYSVWLKHATVQNIVIGGGAGAIPPLVGWAAATGSLNIPALFLFAIVFMWTPPHFWALAIVRKNDYARAGVPMLPVVAGEHKTRVQIFIYTLELVALTLLMPLFKMAGSIFLISASALGVWLIYSAWQVLRKPGNKVAWMMYRYSSMYLMFIFLALVLDVLI